MINYCEEYWDDVSCVTKQIPNVDVLYGKTILITGGTGLIGSSVVDVLLFLNCQSKANINIILAGRSKKRMEERFCRFEEGKDYSFAYYDAEKEMELQIKADYIIHAASNAHPAAYVKEPVQTILANIVGLNNLLATGVKNRAKRLLYVSSSEVYGDIGQVRQFEENDCGYVDILNVRSCYPSAKRAAETLCVAYNGEYGMDTVIVRPGHIYGPAITSSDTRASAEFTRNAAKGENIIMKSAGSQLRSYCYCLDCASAILAVLINGQPANAYNISNRNAICTISDLAQALASCAGKKVEFCEATMQEKKGYNPMSNSSLNSEKIESLGWKALFDIACGAKKTYRYFALDSEADSSLSQR